MVNLDYKYDILSRERKTDSPLQTLANSLLTKKAASFSYYLNKIQLQYLQSGQTSTENLTTIQYRDLMISVCIGLISRCCQTSDTERKNLSLFTKSCVGLNPDSNKLVGAGNVGSISFFYSNIKEYRKVTAVDIVENSLMSFWLKLGLNPFDSANSRLRVYYTQISVLGTNWKDVEEILFREFNTRESRYRDYFKANNVSPVDWENLGVRYATGNVRPAVLCSLKEIIKLDIDNYLKLAAPCGPTLVYLALVVESLFYAILFLNSLPSELTFNSYSTFVDSKEYRLKYELAQRLSLGLDAARMLNVYNNLLEFKDFEFRLEMEIRNLLYQQNSIKPENKYRLNVIEDIV
jgi:hypothetical protein